MKRRPSRHAENSPLRSILGTLALLVVLAGSALLLLAAFRAGPAPALSLETTTPLALGPKTRVVARAQAGGRGLSRLRLELRQGDRVRVLAEKAHAARPAWALWGPRATDAAFDLVLGAESLAGFAEGDATLRLVAERAPAALRGPAPAVRELARPVRRRPPPLQRIAGPARARQGGSGVVVYRVGPTSRRDGVGVGEWWFPGQALPGGGPQDRFALYGVPHDHQDVGAVRLVAEDDVGNRADLPVLTELAAAPASADTIEITDDFVAKVSADILPRAPELKAGGDPVETFLAINRDLRRANAETLVELARVSAPRFLFTAPFLPLPRAKVMSAFADRRAYRYLGREIDQQTHLGFDLASTRRTAVPAANDGMVVLARYLGIYGQAVVVDHGVGLMSLYAHLSSLEVAQGQAVARGDVLGRTGATGLAGGDHLHFTMLVRGLPVDPKEWWDRRFVAERIAGPLGPGVLPFGAAPRPPPAMD